MLDPAQLAALAMIHRRGSFELAAAALHITPSAISQRLKALESATGTLLIRRGQPCHATDIGLRLIRHYDDIALLEAQLSQELPRITSSPVSLRLAINADSLATWVLPALAEVKDFLFDIVIDDQDYSIEWLRRGEVVGVITAHPQPLPSCDMLALGSLRYLASCGPDFHRQYFAKGVDRQSLMLAPAISFSDKDHLQTRWAFQQIGQKISFPNHHMASSQAFVEAAKLGIGWGMNPDILIREDLEQGRLVELIPNTPLDVDLYWHCTRLAAPALKTLTQALYRHAKAALIAP